MYKQFLRLFMVHKFTRVWLLHQLFPIEPAYFLVERFDKNSIFLKFQLSRTLGTTSAFQLKIRKNSKNRRFYPKIVNKINSLC